MATQKWQMWDDEENSICRCSAIESQIQARKSYHENIFSSATSDAAERVECDDF